MSPVIRAFFDEPTNTLTYLVWDAATRQAAVIDPVLDFDIGTGKIDPGPLTKILDVAEEQKLEIVWVLETHAHADHVSGAPFIKARTKALIGIGEHITDVQRIFSTVFNTKAAPDDFDRLFTHGETFALGALDVEVIYGPGHTPADVAYKIGDCVFVGDTLFMLDYGTARADFPGGDARALYRSIRNLLALPPETRLFICHDYKVPGREAYAWETTVQAQREHNLHIHDGVTEDEFVALRRQRDAVLEAPKLLLPSIQVNIRAGKFPAAQSNGVRYLVIPVIE